YYPVVFENGRVVSHGESAGCAWGGEAGSRGPVATRSQPGGRVLRARAADLDQPPARETEGDRLGLGLPPLPALPGRLEPLVRPAPSASLSSAGSTRIRTMRSLTTWLARSLLIGVAGLGWGNSRAPGSCSTALFDDAVSGRVSRHAPTRVAVNTTRCSCPEIKCGVIIAASCSVLCEAPSKAQCTCARCNGPPVNQIISENSCVCQRGP